LPVRVVGVDLSAEPVRTAVAVLEWVDGKAVVEDLRVGADDEAIQAALMTADKAGIDAPFGWPDAFTAFLVAHQAGNVSVPGGLTGQQWRRQLAWRYTDETIRKKTDVIPLSVAADRIGHAAMRCAGAAGETGEPRVTRRPRRVGHGDRGLPGSLAEAVGPALPRVQAAAQPRRAARPGQRTGGRWQTGHLDLRVPSPYPG